jgi:hypothetical protein
MLENNFMIPMTLADQLGELGYLVRGPAYWPVEAVALASERGLAAVLLNRNIEGSARGVVVRSADCPSPRRR